MPLDLDLKFLINILKHKKSASVLVGFDLISLTLSLSITRTRKLAVGGSWGLKCLELEIFVFVSRWDRVHHRLEAVKGMRLQILQIGGEDLLFGSWLTTVLSLSVFGEGKMEVGGALREFPRKLCF